MACITKIERQKYTIAISKTVDGTRKRQKVTFHGTRKEAEAEALRMEQEILLEFGVVTHQNITFSQFAQIWFRDYGNNNLKSKTLRTYKDLLNKYVLRHIGRMKMKSIKPTNIMTMYNSIRSTPKNDKGDLLSPTTINHIHSIIHKIFSDAVRWQYLVDNPVDRVPKPKREKPKPNYLNTEQLDEVLAAFDTIEKHEIKWKTGCYIALMTGLRLAEISGLKWDDIDFKNNVIHVRRTRKYISKVGVVIDTPKTTDSFRTVAIPSSLKEQFYEYKGYLFYLENLCGDLWQDSDYVLVDDFGKECFPDSLSKWFAKFIVRNKLPKVTLHGLRHTMATLLIHDPNVPERTISDRLGHSNTNTLRKIYSHELKESDKLAADSIDQIFKK
ncbi:site-specific integrase [Acidaminobacter sp. JC074]|uniref:tyrosine-type recombinase/integrase n=1 Tax=Acidaminobacter sp. JC074 TaxID=2530199 RepID=UPI001F0EFFDA|nr:site-specific integrase [Acidaminobacter sp. JC074]MCH4891218.1 site-specific integrase [Acidaminobacter sp. JC074]